MLTSEAAAARVIAAQQPECLGHVPPPLNETFRAGFWRYPHEISLIRSLAGASNVSTNALHACEPEEVQARYTELSLAAAEALVMTSLIYAENGFLLGASAARLRRDFRESRQEWFELRNIHEYREAAQELILLKLVEGPAMGLASIGYVPTEKGFRLSFHNELSGVHIGGRADTEYRLFNHLLNCIPEGQFITAADVAKKAGIPGIGISYYLGILCRAGFLSGQRGVGYYLSSENIHNLTNLG